jgi:hypothetical protein
MTCRQECSLKVTVHFTREETFHRGHPLHSVISNYVCGSFYLQRNGIDAICLGGIIQTTLSKYFVFIKVNRCLQLREAYFL